MSAKPAASNPRPPLYFFASDEERECRDNLTEMLLATPVRTEEILGNLGLYLDSKNLSRILCMDFLYRQIVDVQGVVMEFGTKWGQNVALFTALRGIYDPFNRARKVIAFDTFNGFPSLAPEDGEHQMMQPGNLATPDKYEDYLARILDIHEELNPIAHLKKSEIRKGDASVEVPRYLKEHSETIIALAYFDFDLYEPTKNVLKAIEPHLVKGSVLAFDELNDASSPGETVALNEVFGLRNIRLKRFPYASRVSYCVVE